MVKYTDEAILAAISDSRSVSDVMRALGITYISGGMHSHISRRIKALGVDTSHFLGQAYNRGKTFSKNRVEAKDVFVRRGAGFRRPHRILKRLLLEQGREESCEECGQGTTWGGSPLELHVDHINGQPLDDREENLRFLCPNCHSQQTTGFPKKKHNLEASRKG